MSAVHPVVFSYLEFNRELRFASLSIQGILAVSAPVNEQPRWGQSGPLFF